MSLTTRFKCPACGADASAAVTSELLRHAAEKGAARVVARCPHGHAVLLTMDQYGYIRSAIQVQEAAKPDCEITDKTPPAARQRLQAILEKGPATDADVLLLEKAKAAGWVICL
jgi:transcription elongation factor Elf1